MLFWEGKWLSLSACYFVLLRERYLASVIGVVNTIVIAVVSVFVIIIGLVHVNANGEVNVYVTVYVPTYNTLGFSREQKTAHFIHAWCEGCVRPTY